jgi:hypothetical protein
VRPVPGLTEFAPTIGRLACLPAGVFAAWYRVNSTSARNEAAGVKLGLTMSAPFCARIVHFSPL